MDAYICNWLAWLVEGTLVKKEQVEIKIETGRRGGAEARMPRPLSFTSGVYQS